MRKRSSSRAGIIAAAIITAAIFATASIANNLVYHPLNPSFGGDPNMYAWLFGLAGAENLFSGGSGGNGNGGLNGGTGGIGGPVIVINPGSTSVGSPSVSADTDARVEQVN